MKIRVTTPMGSFESVDHKVSSEEFEKTLLWLKNNVNELSSLQLEGNEQFHIIPGEVLRNSVITLLQ